MRRFALQAVLAIVAAAGAGCSPLHRPTRPAQVASDQASSNDPRSSMPPTQVAHEPERHRASSSKRAAAKSNRAPASDHQSTVTASNPGPDTTPPSLTLAGESPSRAQALELIDKADRSLAKIDKSKLTGNDVSTYDQASDFVTSAQRALGENDYFAASGLAQKASILTARLTR